MASAHSSKTILNLELRLCRVVLKWRPRTSTCAKALLANTLWLWYMSVFFPVYCLVHFIKCHQMWQDMRCSVMVRPPGRLSNGLLLLWVGLNVFPCLPCPWRQEHLRMDVAPFFFGMLWKYWLIYAPLHKCSTSLMTAGEEKLSEICSGSRSTAGYGFCGFSTLSKCQWTLTESK